MLTAGATTTAAGATTIGATATGTSPAGTRRATGTTATATGGTTIVAGMMTGAWRELERVVRACGAVHVWSASLRPIPFALNEMGVADLLLHVSGLSDGFLSCLANSCVSRV